MTIEVYSSFKRRFDRKFRPLEKRSAPCEFRRSFKRRSDARKFRSSFKKRFDPRKFCFSFKRRFGPRNVRAAPAGGFTLARSIRIQCRRCAPAVKELARKVIHG